MSLMDGGWQIQIRYAWEGRVDREETQVRKLRGSEKIQGKGGSSVMGRK